MASKASDMTACLHTHSHTYKHTLLPINDYFKCKCKVSKDRVTEWVRKQDPSL